jgi:hypothetical protein
MRNLLFFISLFALVSCSVEPENQDLEIRKGLQAADKERADRFLRQQGFVESKSNIKTFDDLLKHLQEYKDIWKKILDDSEWKYLNDTLMDLSKLESKGKIKNLKTMVSKEEFLTAMPREGGMFEIMYDLWDKVIEGKK